MTNKPKLLWTEINSSSHEVIYFLYIFWNFHTAYIYMGSFPQILFHYNLVISDL